MTQKLRAACVQITSTDNPAHNRAHITPLIERAAMEGADLVTLPENTDILGLDCDALQKYAVAEDAHETLTLVRSLAAKHKVWILLGSIVVRNNAGGIANRGYLINADGAIVARYDKIHLFDSDVAGVRYRESDKFQAGNCAVVAETPWGGIGLSICYDLRFPQLYRALAKAGANIIGIPAAFIVATGEKHWHVLLRARAIETGCFIVAPAQCGNHVPGRDSFGHSLIIAPSGEIVAEAGKFPGVIMAELDLTAVTKARESLPTLKHDREFELPSVSTQGVST